ncbi:3'-5' exoribonuclease YhaM family protein [Alkalihalobacterium elongatum]|uniref:3'-5' exoribonuclease YhaM family protein n=1 Tax=Alkalihalobacterium elongatum TaxID=2675466 RepID=UPI001F22C0D8|nr:3'-5' exoribonuclease YhaM family protein [Alkalihalobacterium elongatum]
MNKQEGERIVDYFIVRDRETSIATNGSEYISLTLSNKDGVIRAKVWDVTEKQKEWLIKRSMIKVDALVTFYRGQRQLNIQRVRLVTDDDAVELNDLLNHASIPREDLWQELRMFIEDIESETLCELIKTLLKKKDIREKLTTIPAAKQYHHAYYAGLLEHIVTLCHVSAQLLQVYPQLNKDVILAVCILHDIGKTKALSDPVVPDYTTNGELIGHVVLSIEMIIEGAIEAGISTDHHEVLAVKHCILSGHVQDSVQSGVNSKTAEAIFFQHINKLDNQLNALFMIGNETNEEWTFSPMFKRRMYTSGN